jgi:tRNA(Ile)-lysidine synthase
VRPDPAEPGALDPGRSRDELVTEVARVLSSLPHGAAVVVACSGGPDSTALASLTADARPDLDLTLAYVAHGLRDPAADAAEAALVTQLAEWLGAGSVTLPVTVVRTGDGLEADARRARYAALGSELARRDAQVLLLGHHADDQAETLLLRLARGTGPDGLGGMAAVRGVRVRPLLRIRRIDLVRHCELEGLPSALDPMNRDLEVRRVRVREELLPALARLGPDPVGALSRLAALARDESAALELLATRAARELGVRQVGAVHLVPSAGLRALPVGLARRLLRALLDAPRAGDVERVLCAPDGWRATLPGPRDVSVAGGWHVIAPVSATEDPSGAAPPVRLAVRAGDGLSAAAARRAWWAPTGWSIVAAPLDDDGGAAQLPLVDAGRLAPGMRTERLTAELAQDGPFLVRARRDGDRIRTPGGTRTLADVIAEAGVPRAVRELLPVVVRAADDTVLWVPGIVVDEDVRAQAGRPARVRLELDVLARHVAGPATPGPLPSRHGGSRSAPGPSAGGGR